MADEEKPWLSKCQLHLIWFIYCIKSLIQVPITSRVHCFIRYKLDNAFRTSHSSIQPPPLFLQIHNMAWSSAYYVQASALLLHCHCEVQMRRKKLVFSFVRIKGNESAVLNVPTYEVSPFWSSPYPIMAAVLKIKFLKSSTHFHLEEMGINYEWGHS